MKMTVLLEKTLDVHVEVHLDFGPGPNGGPDGNSSDIRHAYILQADGARVDVIHLMSAEDLELASEQAFDEAENERLFAYADDDGDE